MKLKHIFNIDMVWVVQSPSIFK